MFTLSNTSNQATFHYDLLKKHVQWTLDTKNPLYNEPLRLGPPWRIQEKSRKLQRIPGHNESFARVQKGSLYPGFTVGPLPSQTLTPPTSRENTLSSAHQWKAF